MASCNEKLDFRLMVAPLQGLTEAPFRRFHAELFPIEEEKLVTYFTPFVRIEKGKPRARDMRDIISPLNNENTLIPQVIARDGDEFMQLVEAIVSKGYTHVDLNAGCPFPPQVHKGRGAGLLKNSRGLEEIACRMIDMKGMQFSLKMRLGVDSACEWRESLPIINSMPLEYVTIHPRTARQQYSGEIDYGSLNEFIVSICHHIIYNGEIASPGDISAIRSRFPELKGVMVGRGLLRRPSMFVEYLSGTEWGEPVRRQHIMALHKSLCTHYAACLCGDAQILTKLKPFWEFFGSMFPPKQIKAVVKSRALPAYMSAVAALMRDS